MRRSHLAALTIAVALVAAARSARAQQPAPRPTPEQPRGGDARRTPAAQLLAAVEDAGATAMALEGGAVTNVRLVSAAEVLDAAGRASLERAVAKNAADVARLRRAAGGVAAIRTALAAANVPAERIVGVAVSSGGVVVYHAP